MRSQRRAFPTTLRRLTVLASLAIAIALAVGVPSAADAQAPTVSFTSPASGATISGTLSTANCEAVASSNTTRVVFWVNNLQITNDYSAPWNCSFDSTQLSDGPYTLRAVAFNDTAGLSTTAQLPITINNSTPPPPPPSGAPTVSFRSPINGATVSGTLSGANCEATASATTTRVVFWIDATQLNVDAGAPWNCTFDTATVADGGHTLKAVAYDDATGLSGTAQIALNVANSTGPPTTGGVAVPTFHSLGLYWAPPSDPGSAGCTVRYRASSESVWRDGLAMWYDARNNECRGSLVLLSPGTTYVVQMGMPGQAPSVELTQATWSEQFPIAEVHTLAAGTLTEPLVISQGGTANGYILYQAAPGGTTIDVANGRDNNVTISAPYVIVRGLTLKGAGRDAIDLIDGAHDVVIESNDISGWGRLNYTNSKGWQIGVDMDSGVRGHCAGASIPLERVIIQRNRIHDPRYGANSWSWGHPAGPQGITFSFCGGNHVIRYNEIYSSDQQHYFNDGIGGEDNFTATGFPNYDTDIYGNRISQAWDDAIEAEGGDRNVRIWGNYLDQTATGIASTVNHEGPLYIFRNVYNRSRTRSESTLDNDDRNGFAKSGDVGAFGGGRRYVFHNTLLQATDSSATYPLGAGGGLYGTGDTEPMTNTVSRNNILHVWKDWWSVFSNTGSGVDADYDLYNGPLTSNLAVSEPNGIHGTPTYADGNGWVSEAGGMYQLAPSSPGYDRGVRLPNFNDDYLGAAPDIGAHEAGSPAMKFGVNQ